MTVKLLGAAALVVLLALAMIAAGIASNRPPITDPPGMLARLGVYLTRNVAETGPGAVFPELAPLLLRGDARSLREQVAAACRELGWQQVEAPPGSDAVRAQVRSALFGFVDDVEIRLLEHEGVMEGDMVEARVRAASRVGRGDLGANARHVMNLRAELARRGLLQPS